MNGLNPYESPVEVCEQPTQRPTQRQSILQLAAANATSIGLLVICGAVSIELRYLIVLGFLVMFLGAVHAVLSSLSGAKSR